MKNKKELTLLITTVLIVLLISIGVSFAWFSANITGGEDPTTITVAGGSMKIVYNGGAYEYTSAYVDNGHSNLTTNGANIINSNSKYKNIYVMGTTDTRPNNYEANKNVYGDGVYETSSTGENSTTWYGDYSYMPYTLFPFFHRGGNYSNNLKSILITTRFLSVFFVQ